MIAPCYDGLSTPLAPVGDMASLENGYPFDSENFMPSGVTPLVRIRDLTSSEFETFVDIQVPERVMLRDGDVVIGMDGDFNVIRWSRGPAALNQRLCRLRGIPTADLRFVEYALPAALQFINETQYATTVKHLSSGEVLSSRIPSPPIGEQRRIADFLDDQTRRIDRIITARQRQLERLEESRLGAALAMIRGDGVPGERRSSGLRWLGDIPADWIMTTVQSAYEVMLGKMLDENKFTGRHAVPYLRNTNVQWDRVDTADLKTMDIEPSELSRFTVRPGDLLICEGGQPGRCAIWEGSVSPMGYQKALHRARPRDERQDVRWLQNYLRSAVYMNVFAVENGQATIGHLTGEQVRALRLPVPDRATQRVLLSDYHREHKAIDAGVRDLQRSVELLREFKRSLISAAVSGEFDVSAASGRGAPA